jgi:hypothetical protein
MLKRNFTLAALCSLLTLPAYAHEFSIGAGALSSTLYSQISLEDTTLGSTANTYQWSANGNAITGEFYLGYAYNINKGFDIGAEVFYLLDGPEIQQWVLEDRYLQYSVKSSLGIRIVPGFNITPSTRVIAEVGYLFMSTEINVKELDIASDFSSNTATKDTGLIVYGVGLETMIYENFGFRASYNVGPRMGDIDSSSGSATISSTDETLTYSANPALGMFYLGGIIRFSF